MISPAVRKSFEGGWENTGVGGAGGGEGRGASRSNSTSTVGGVAPLLPPSDITPGVVHCPSGQPSLA